MDTPPLHWLEISRSALLTNLASFRQILPPSTRIMAMVKANAYGHGLDIVAPVLSPQVDYFGVHTFEEAISIRKLHLSNPILITAPISFSHIPLAADHRLSLSVPSLAYLNQLPAIPLRIHLKIDTGMHRLGLLPREVPVALRLLNKSPHLTVEGVYTHFYSGGLPKTTAAQLDLFCQAVSLVKRLYPQALAHCANSIAALNFPHSHLDMVRLGAGIYGLSHNSPHKQPLNLHPALSWKAQLIQTKRVPAGSIVGYDAQYTFKQAGYLGILPFGYSDGYDRSLTNTGHVYLHTAACPVIGRVSMNMTTIRLPRLCPPGTVIEIIGPHVSAFDLAQSAKTITYEIVSRLNPLLPRQLV
jgi:alanine racemase